MAMFKKFDAVVTTGTYTDKNGQEKKRYANVGAVFEDDQGRMSLKLDLMPVSGFNGWVSFYEPKPKEGGQPQPVANNQAGGFNDLADDIPF